MQRSLYEGQQLGAKQSYEIASSQAIHAVSIASSGTSKRAVKWDAIKANNRAGTSSSGTMSHLEKPASRQGRHSCRQRLSRHGKRKQQVDTFMRLTTSTRIGDIITSIQVISWKMTDRARIQIHAGILRAVE
jgi:hypothetical protein